MKKEKERVAFMLTSRVKKEDIGSATKEYMEMLLKCRTEDVRIFTGGSVRYLVEDAKFGERAIGKELYKSFRNGCSGKMYPTNIVIAGWVDEKQDDIFMWAAGILGDKWYGGAITFRKNEKIL